MMLKPDEKKQIAAHLMMLFKTFPSSRTIEPEAVVFFVEDVAEFSFRAVEETIKRFRKGEIPNRNPAFAPSVPEFVSEVRARQEKLDFDAFWEKTDFIEFGSPEWDALVHLRGRSMPQIERKGKVGWYVPKEEVAAIPPALLEDGGRPLALPSLKTMGGDA